MEFLQRTGTHQGGKPLFLAELFARKMHFHGMQEGWGSGRLFFTVDSTMAAS
jgi:hypothetical protein